MPFMTRPISFKAPAAEGDQAGDTGRFEALVSVFGNKDAYGDMVMPGAFTRTLSEWAAKGDPIPIYFSHQTQDPEMNIGQVIEAKETEQGLLVDGQLDLDSAKGAYTYKLMKGRRLTQFSFAYSVRDGGFDEQSDAYQLRDLDLYEVGPTPIGANPDTELVAVKNAIVAARHVGVQLKAGRVLSAKNESELRDAYTAIGRVLDSLPSTDEASGNGRAKDEEPSGAKSEEPRRMPSVDTVLARLSITRERTLS